MSDFLVQMQRLFFMLTKIENQNDYSAVLDMENFRSQLERLGVKISYDQELKWFTLLDISGDG